MVCTSSGTSQAPFTARASSLVISNPFVILRFPVNGDGREDEPATIYTDGFAGRPLPRQTRRSQPLRTAFTGIWNACRSPAARPSS